MSDMTQYKATAPKGWGGDPKRGAALGRAAVCDVPADARVRLRVRRLYLNAGGYDCAGVYWGEGAPLWWVSNKELTVDFVLRASSRDEAIARVRQKGAGPLVPPMPNAVFTRVVSRGSR